MLKKLFAGLVVVLALVVPAMTAAPGSSNAAEKIDRNAAKRSLNFADRQLMLLQRMSKEILLVALDVNAAQNLENLDQSLQMFDSTLWALRDGDATLGLAATTEATTLSSLTVVEDQWPPFDDAIRASLQTGQVNRGLLDTLAEVEPPLYEAMDKAVDSYFNTAISGRLFSTLTMMIRHSGRQRMLTQKMTKEFLFIAYGYEVEKNRQNLLKSIDLFESNLSGLIDGDPERRLMPAPSVPIRMQLRNVQRLWDEVLQILKTAAVNGTADRKAVATVAELNQVLLDEMSKAVDMYEVL